MRIYQYLKWRTNRSPSEHILFSKIMAIIDQLNPTKRATLMATREMRSGQKPDPPFPKKIAEFMGIRETFLNKSLERLLPTSAEPPQPKRNCIPPTPILSTDSVGDTPPQRKVKVDLEVIPDKRSVEGSQIEDQESPRIVFPVQGHLYSPSRELEQAMVEVEMEIFREECTLLETRHNGER